MGKIYDSIDDTVGAFIARQHVFFVATAPRADDGLLNVSPKGGDSFRVLGPRLVAYRDLTGSGVETIAHLRENGRIVVMFCAFEGAPRILRLHGHGEVIEVGHPDHDALAARRAPSARGRALAIIRIEAAAGSPTRAGCAVPVLEYREEARPARRVDRAQGAGGAPHLLAREEHACEPRRACRALTLERLTVTTTAPISPRLTASNVTQVRRRGRRGRRLLRRVTSRRGAPHGKSHSREASIR